jgi:hypothetical protein
MAYEPEREIAESVASKLWRSKRFTKMKYLEVFNLAYRVGDAFGWDESLMYEFLDRTLDPSLTYHENLDLVNRGLAEALRRTLTPEEAKALQERWRAEVGMTYDEAKARLIELLRARGVEWTPDIEKQFDEEWEVIAGQRDRREQERMIVALANEKAKRIAPPPVKVKPVPKPMAVTVPEKYREFYELWMRYFEELTG